MKTSETAIWEILVMLLGAFVLGMLVVWALYRHRQRTVGAHQSSTEVATTKDDLTVIEGIGPRIQELLFDAGIESYKDLSRATRSEVKEILDQAGPRYRLHEPKTWIEQATLAADGRFDELEQLQARLTGG